MSVVKLKILDPATATTPKQFELELERAFRHVYRSIIDYVVNLKSTQA